MCDLREALRRRLRTARPSLRVDRMRPSATVVLEGWSPPIFGSEQNPAYRSTRLHLRCWCREMRGTGSADRFNGHVMPAVALCSYLPHEATNMRHEPNRSVRTARRVGMVVSQPFRRGQETDLVCRSSREHRFSTLGSGKGVMMNSAIVQTGARHGWISRDS